MKDKLIRITTVPLSLEKLLENQLKFMSSYYKVIAISGEKERLEKFGEDQNVQTFYVELTRRITPLKDLKAVYKLYKFLKKEKPKIVHTHTPKAGLVGMLASYFAKVPNRLHTVAGLPLMEATGMKRKTLNFVEKLTYRCATKVYPNSKGLQEFIIKNKFTTNNKLKIIANGSSNGIDTNYFDSTKISQQQKQDLKESLKIENDDFVFIFVGRIVGDKGINELVNAFDQLSKKNKRVKLLLVGALESELDPLQQKTQELIVKNIQIISVGYQEDVRPYFAIANTLVFPSYREGFPNVVMQAGAMELPSIVSDINGCNEIISDNVNGNTILVKDVKAIYNQMDYYIAHKSKVENMKSRARKTMVDNYKREVVWKALLQEYKNIETSV